MFREVRERVPGMNRVVLSTHSHNDLGLAMANTLAGIRGGARQVECTINGIGERAGNAALEEVVMALRLRQADLGFETAVHTEELYPASCLLTRLTGVAVQPNKAIVGKNAFAHEAGIHQDGVLKCALTYEIMTPASVGVPSTAIVLGKHSGRHALTKRFEELGYTLTRLELDHAYELFCRLADRKKRIYDEDLIEIASRGFEAMPQSFNLRRVETRATSDGASAAVEIERDGKTLRAASDGGDIEDAVFRAIDQITGMSGKLADFSAHTFGTNGQHRTEVSVQVLFSGCQFTGKATAPLSVDAAGRAYLQAANKAVVHRDQGELAVAASPSEQLRASAAAGAD